MKDIIKHADKSEVFMREFRKYRDQILPQNKKKELQNDVETRWNSSVVMLKSFLELHDAVDLTIKKMCTDDEKKKFFVPPAEIDMITNLIDLLDSLKRATDQWQGEKYCTVSTIYPVIFAVVNGMKKQSSQGFSKELKNFKSTLITNLIERFCLNDEEFLGSMSIPMISTYLDDFVLDEFKHVRKR